MTKGHISITKNNNNNDLTKFKETAKCLNVLRKIGVFCIYELNIISIRRQVRDSSFFYFKILYVIIKSFGDYTDTLSSTQINPPHGVQKLVMAADDSAETDERLMK